MPKRNIFNEKETNASTFDLFEYQLNIMSKHISLRISAENMIHPRSTLYPLIAGRPTALSSPFWRSPLKGFPYKFLKNTMGSSEKIVFRNIS